MLTMQGVSKSFLGVRVLHDVDLDLRAGEVHALVGENGAGKSTLMKILAGEHVPDGGRLTLDGTPAPSPTPPRRRRPESASSTRSSPCWSTARSPRTSSWGASRAASAWSTGAPWSGAPPNSSARSTRRASPRAPPSTPSPSPAARPSRSSRRSPPTYGSWSWTSRPRRSPSTRWRAWRRWSAARRPGPGHPLHLAPAARGLRPVAADHRPQGRPARHHPGHRLDRLRRRRPRHGRPRP